VVATTGSVNFIGSGRLIPGLNGTTFGTGPAPAIAGGFRASGIGFFGITAYNITEGLSGNEADGIRLLNVQNFLIDGNTIDLVGSDGIDVRSNGSNVSAGTIVGNTITEPGDAGLELDAREGSTLTVLALNNELGGGLNDLVKVSAREGATMNFTAIGNGVVGGGSDGFDILATESGTVNLTVLSNEIFGFEGDGIYLFAEEGATLHANISDNLIAFIGDDGIDFDAFDGSEISFRAERNQIGFISDYAIATEMYNAATGTAEIHNNEIIFVGTDAVQFFLSGGGVSLTANVNGNSISGTFSDGIDGNTLSGAELIINAANNVLNGIEDDGFDFQTSTFGNITATLTNNTVNEAENGMFLRATFGGQLDVTVLGGTIMNSADNGIEASTDFGLTAVLDLAVTGTTFIDNADHHIRIYSGSSTTLNTVASGSIFLLSTGTPTAAIFAESEDSSIQSLVAYGNAVTNTGGLGGDSAGFIVRARDGSEFEVHITSNVLTNLANSPIAITSDDNPLVTGSVTGNIITNVENAAAISIFAIDGGTVGGGVLGDFVVSGNSVSGTLDPGLLIGVDGSGTVNTQVFNNTIIGSQSSGMSFQTITGGDLTVNGFNGNSILNVMGDGVTLAEDGGTLIINGTPNTGNNIINNVGGLRVNDVFNNVQGIFHIGAPVNVNRTDNTDVP
jgi:hypothetical protein